MAIRTDKSVFYHIPKTGGIWVKEAMRQSGCVGYGRCRDIKGRSQKFGLKREHATPDVVRDGYKKGLFSFCFVRHPVAWFKSFWCYRVKTGHLDVRFPSDRLWDGMFETFIVNVLKEFSDGFVTELYQYYVGETADKVDFVGKQENLADDLVKALTLAGEDFNEEDLRRTKWRNVSAGHSKYGDMCVLSTEVRDRILKADRWVINNFYVKGVKSNAESNFILPRRSHEQDKTEKIPGQASGL